MEKFHQEISSLKSVFKGNGYPKNLIDSCIKHQFLCFLEASLFMLVGSFRNMFLNLVLVIIAL